MPSCFSLHLSVGTLLALHISFQPSSVSIYPSAFFNSSGRTSLGKYPFISYQINFQSPDSILLGACEPESYFTTDELS